MRENQKLEEAMLGVGNKLTAEESTGKVLKGIRPLYSRQYVNEEGRGSFLAFHFGSWRRSVVLRGWGEFMSDSDSDLQLRFNVV